LTSQIDYNNLCEKINEILLSKTKHRKGGFMEIKMIGVLGAGSMGNGIAQVAAQAGYQVVMRDIEERFVDNGLKAIGKFLAKSVEKGKMTEEQKKGVLGRIKGTTRMEDLKDADFVIEAVFEDLDLKKSVFKQLDELTRPGVILTTNTSSMSITEIAVSTKRPEKVGGMHFFNPAPIMKLVEVIRGYHTDDETVHTVMEMSKKMGKEPVEVKKDTPGFIVNRLMIPHMVEAIKMLEEGVATPEDIDKAVKMGLNYPMGPFELMDLTGVDITLHVTEYLYKELNKESKWSAPTLFKSMVRAGRLGRKTGAGWYKY
jgi:3-hydroxybutyryl-CoA dehydrogenase